MDSLYSAGWIAFAVGFGWRVLDEVAGHLIFRITGPMAKAHEERDAAR
jgi:hypothetical protein